MTSANNFIERVAQYEHEGAGLEAQELDWYEDFVNGVVATGEMKLRQELQGYYQEHLRSKSTKVLSIWSAVGIAAMLAIGGIYFSTIQSASEPIQLKTNEAPVYGDSATYDTTENKVEKKSENNVDK